ncbi:precorrin-6y C5,15-methyltransferase (decarboxylating), CbiE subunit [Mycobacterium xenopi 3993]|nr:precorrin-6y C5,15-methyltransferase (decarboxylating), CbiE subunit [Mycobacterium xenopi 3993]
MGIGADGMAGLSEASRYELRKATVIYGSQRQLDLLDDSVAAARRPWPSPMLPALQGLLDSDSDVHVLASGDPLLYGIGSTLIRLFGAERVRVLPHVSAVTLACARMGWTVADTEVISLVTAEPHTAVRQGGQAIVLSRDVTTPTSLARLLTENGRGESEFTVLEQLGGPKERRRDGTAREWAASGPDDVDDLNVIAVRYLPDERVSPVRDDALFHDGQITKQSMRAVTLAALAPRPGSGCGMWVRARAASLSSGAAAGVAARLWRSNGTSSAAIASPATRSRSG